MGLQVRVKHALGSRLIELPDRTIDNPITVGRASGVDVQVPSVSVAARHCVLFCYDGHWAVQDVRAASGSGTSGTFVNGQQVDDPVMLQIGDVISVGSESSAPTIEVDPAAAAEGRTGWAGDELTAVPMVPGYAAPAGYGAPPTYAASGGYVSTTGYGATGYGGNTPAPRPAPAGPAATGWDAAGLADNGDHVDMSAPVATSSYSRSYRRKKKQQTPLAAIVIGALVCCGIVGFTIWWATSHPQTVVVQAQPKPKVVDDSNHSNNIFGIGGGAKPDRSNEVSSARPPAGRQPVTPDNSDPVGNSGGNSGAAPATPAHPGSTVKPAPSGSGNPPATPAGGGTPPQQVASAGTTAGSDEMTPATPTKNNPAAPPAPTDEWQEMQDLHNTPADPALAIFRFSDYQKRHAGQHADDMQRYIDDKFDRLWWDRIEQLFKKTDRLKSDVEKKQNDIFDETDKDMKKKEQDELAKLKADQKLTKETIADKMSYKDEQPPPAGGAELAALREKRDNAKFTEWKRTTLNSIINNHGATDWAADK